jgi:hypothetical protein
MSTEQKQNTASAAVDLGAFAAAKHEYCHAAAMESDSNQLAGGARVGAPDKLLTREGGADDPSSTTGPGGPGRSLA